MNLLRPLDYIVLTFYLLGVTAIGVWVTRGQRDAKDFLLASRSMAWLPVGISIVASFISGISYTGIPAEIANHGFGFLLYAFAYVLVIPVVLRVFLPFYAGRNITTAYEYLSGRFNLSVRRLASGMFIIWRMFWIATVIYVPCLVISVVTGMPLLPTLLTVGILTSLYTAAGGMKAVIWTDFTQFFVMFGGAVLAIGFIAAALPGGLTGIWGTAEAAGRTRMIEWSLDPIVRITVWGALAGGFFANLASFGVDQVIIQRYLTTRSLRDLRRTYLLNSAALFLVVAVLSFLGLALFAFYDRNPGLLPPSVQRDHLLPHFIAHQFPPGLAGLLVAAILAASMSSLSAGISAVTTALFNDFLPTARKSGEAGGQGLWRARGLSLAVGLAGTAFASLVGKLGTIMEIAVRLIDGFSGPLLAIFLVGIFTRRVGPTPVLIAAPVGIALTACANFFSPVSFMWYPVIGCLSTLLLTVVTHGLLERRPKEVGRVEAMQNAD